MSDVHLNKALADVGKLITDKLKSLAKADKFYASGKLDTSFRYEVVKKELVLHSEEYARALSEGIKLHPEYNKQSPEFRASIIKWAKTRGMRPNAKNSKGQYTKIKQYHWNSMAIAIGKSIRNNGISKRFGYKGSGFIDKMEDSLKQQMLTILTAGYKKDLIERIKNKI